MNLISEDVRLVYLTQGGSPTRTAEELGVDISTVQYHVSQANARQPLTYGQGTPEERAAMSAYLRHCLRRVHIESG